ncbi:MAG: hypothetical protein WC840_04935 [Candidatus Peribacteraceae bacterium]
MPALVQLNLPALPGDALLDDERFVLQPVLRLSPSEREELELWLPKLP